MNKKPPPSLMEEADSLDEFLNREQSKVMAKSVDRIYKMLRKKTERSKSKCEKERNEKNSQKFLDDAQDFFHFTQMLTMITGLTAQVLMLQSMVTELTEAIEKDMGIAPPVDDDPEPNKPN